MNLSALGDVMAFEISGWDILAPRFAFEQFGCRGLAKDKVEVVGVVRLDA
jgi:hypothetical protein